MTPFQEWVDGQIAAAGQARRLAERIKADDSVIHSWLYRGILPTPDHETRLAEATGVPLETIQALVEQSWRQQRAEVAERRKRRLARVSPSSSHSYPEASQNRARKGLAFAGFPPGAEPLLRAGAS